MDDGMKVTGRARFVITGPDGKVKDDETVTNTVTTVGKQWVADQLSDQGELAMTHMAVGTGSPSGTALGSELDRNALTSTTQSTNTVIYVGDWAAADGTGTITEAGIFNDASAGTMLCSATTSKVKAAGDTLKITWTLTIS